MLKNTIKALIFLTLIIFSVTTAIRSYAQEQIDSYKVFVQIQESGVINVHEKILYNFGNDQRHGIFREIPFTKTNNSDNKYEMDIVLQEVYDQNNYPINYTTSTSSDILKIKIGDANALITGQNEYNIEYEVSGALTYFDEHDELYWNLLGTRWQVPTKDFTAEISLPETINTADIDVKCFTGRSGSTTQDCTTSVIDNTIKIQATRPLSSYEGLTSVVTFPKNHVAVLEPQLVTSLTDNKILMMFLLLLAGLNYLVFPFLPIYKWWKERNYVKNNAQIVAAWFSPPKNSEGIEYTPAETALLINKTFDKKMLTSIIIDLARRGFLEITVKEKDGIFSSDEVFLTRKKDFMLDQTLRPYEIEFLTALFTGKDPGIASEIAKLLGFQSNEEAKNTVALKKASKNYKLRMFATNLPKKLGEVIKSYGDTSKELGSMRSNNTFLVVLGAFTFNIFLTITSAIFGRKMGHYTDSGIKQYGIAKSLQNFLESQDAQYDFQAEEQMFFEKLLPYATAFGIEDVWIKKFPDIKPTDLDWYSSNSNILNMAAMSRTLNSAVGSMTYSGSSSSGFSSGFSGGSSGGGGGGGGGGSW